MVSTVNPSLLAPEGRSSTKTETVMMPFSVARESLSSSAKTDGLTSAINSIATRILHASWFVIGIFLGTLSQQISVFLSFRSKNRKRGMVPLESRLYRVGTSECVWSLRSQLRHPATNLEPFIFLLPCFRQRPQPQNA